MRWGNGNAGVNVRDGIRLEVKKLTRHSKAREETTGS